MALPYKWNLKINNLKCITACIFGLFIFGVTVNAKDVQPEIKFESKEIKIGTKKITVELAETSAQHEKGLMYRESLEPDRGMLFVFDKEQVLSFWMKNTFVNLSIAYINKKLKIIDIQEMKATSALQTATPPSYPSKKPAMYALEMPKGWFKKNNIIIGQSLTLTAESVKKTK